VQPKELQMHFLVKSTSHLANVLKLLQHFVASSTQVCTDWLMITQASGVSRMRTMLNLSLKCSIVPVDSEQDLHSQTTSHQVQTCKTVWVTTVTVLCRNCTTHLSQVTSVETFPWLPA